MGTEGYKEIEDGERKGVRGKCEHSIEGGKSQSACGGGKCLG